MLCSLNPGTSAIGFVAVYEPHYVTLFLKRNLSRASCRIMAHIFTSARSFFTLAAAAICDGGERGETREGEREVKRRSTWASVPRMVGDPTDPGGRGGVCRQVRRPRDQTR